MQVHKIVEHDHFCDQNMIHKTKNFNKKNTHRFYKRWVFGEVKKTILSHHNSLCANLMIRINYLHKVHSLGIDVNLRLLGALHDYSSINLSAC